jgi:hypothetical protein
MPRYHMHVVEGRKKVDPPAVELPNDESAKRHARQLAEGRTRLSPGFGIQQREDCYVDVTDAKGKWIGRCHGNKLSIGSTPGRSRAQQRIRA